MNPAEIAEREKYGVSGFQIFPLLRKSVGQASETAHSHANRKAGALDMRRTDFLRIGIADDWEEMRKWGQTELRGLS